MLKNSKLREPAVMVAILAVYDELAKHLDKEAIAMEILPELWKMCIDSVLNVTQVGEFPCPIFITTPSMKNSSNYLN
jgi:SCY1-like protein 2